MSTEPSVQSFLAEAICDARNGSGTYERSTTQADKVAFEHRAEYVIEALKEKGFIIVSAAEYEELGQLAYS